MRAVIYGHPDGVGWERTEKEGSSNWAFNPERGQDSCSTERTATWNLNPAGPVAVGEKLRPEGILSSEIKERLIKTERIYSSRH